MLKKPFRESDCARSSVEKRINLYGGPGRPIGAATSLLALLWAPRFRDVDPVKQGSWVVLQLGTLRPKECGFRFPPVAVRPTSRPYGAWLSSFPLARLRAKGAAHGIPRQSTEVLGMQF